MDFAFRSPSVDRVQVLKFNFWHENFLCLDLHVHSLKYKFLPSNLCCCFVPVSTVSDAIAKKRNIRGQTSYPQVPLRTLLSTTSTNVNAEPLSPVRRTRGIGRFGFNPRLPGNPHKRPDTHHGCEGHFQKMLDHFRLDLRRADLPAHDRSQPGTPKMA